MWYKIQICRVCSVQRVERDIYWSNANIRNIRMPYSWESTKWLGDGGRLSQHGIHPPPGSGLCAVLPDRWGDILHHPGLLDGVEDSRKKELRGMFDEACEEEKRKQCIFST